MTSRKDRVRMIIAWVLLILGRILLVAMPMMVAICRLTRPLWIDLPQDAGVPDYWICNLTMVVLFVGGMAAPWLVLPVGSVALATRSGAVLRLPTVLGRRVVNLQTATLRRIVMPSQGGASTELLVVRNSLVRWLVVASSGLWDTDPAEATAPLRAPRGGKLSSIVWGIVIVMAMVLSTAVTGTIGGWAAGLV